MVVVNIHQFHKSIMLELVKFYFPSKQKNSVGRPTKYSNEIYINAMFHVLKTGIGWEYLLGYSVKGDTVRKKFSLWTNKNIFKLSWIIMVNIYAEFKIDFTDLFIDCSHIKNYYGTSLIGKNVYDRFKTSTKLSIITDDIGVPIGIALDKGNVHDIKLVQNTLNNIQLEEVNYLSAEFLIADKGYISKDLTNTLIKDYTLKIITPNKRSTEEVNNEKNRIKEVNKITNKINTSTDKLKTLNEQIIQNNCSNESNDIKKRIDDKLVKKKQLLVNKIKTLKDKKKIKNKFPKKRGRKSNADIKLNKRFIVEHTFSWFKKYGRLLIRKDKTVSNFESFIFFGASSIVANKIEIYIRNQKD